MKLPPPEIVGEKVILRPVQEGDFDDVFAYSSDPRVSRYTWWKQKSRQEVIDHFQKIFSRYERGEGEIADWSVESREDGDFLGKCSLRELGMGVLQPGIVLKASCWGKGYGTEICRLLIGVAHDVFAARVLRGACHPDNIGSQRAMEKAGMKHLGLVKDYRVASHIQRDSIIYEYQYG